MPAHVTGLAQVTINAKDLARATAFYRDRVGLKHLFDAPPAMSFFDCGGVRLLVGVAEKPEFDHPGSILYFRTGDIQGDAARMKAEGVHFRDEPHLVAKLPEREIWIAFFDDTEGNLMALMAEISTG